MTFLKRILKAPAWWLAFSLPVSASPELAGIFPKVSCIHLLLQSRPEADSRRVSAKSKFKVKEGSDGVSLIFAASSCWSVPVLHVMSSKTPARIEGQLDTAGSKLYFCPMYRTNCRKNVNVKVVHPYASSGFIVDVVLPCSAPLNVCDPQHLYARLNASFLVEVD